MNEEMEEEDDDEDDDEEGNGMDNEIDLEDEDDEDDDDEGEEGDDGESPSELEVVNEGMLVMNEDSNSIDIDRMLGK
jgi:hypothetical protein